MARISSNTIEQIRHSSDIVSVINGYIKLKRTGNIYKALCPFHKEKTPSFIVSPQRQTFHCFGCGKGGDVFKFVMEYEKIDFYEALGILARRCGIELEFENKLEQRNTSLKTQLYELHQKVAHFYHQTLLDAPSAAMARKYLNTRGLTNAIKPFLIGFAPDSWDALIRWAQKSYPSDLLESAGLIVSSNKEDDIENIRNPRTPFAQKSYDRFRNRVMFPVFDEQGRVVGFSGRIINQDREEAKYINSPETMLFKKGRILYGLHSAKHAIVENKEALIVEGQIDVIRCHLNGFNNAVASQGTAFTEEHCNILRRYTDSVVLVFDGDTAGENAAQKVGGIFLETGLFVRIAILPEGEDPDSLLLKPGSKMLFQKIITEAKGIIDFCVEAFISREGKSTEASTARLARSMLELIAIAQNEIQRSILISRLAQKLDMPETSLRMELRKLTSSRRGRVVSDVKLISNEEQASSTLPVTQISSSVESDLIAHILADPARTVEQIKLYLPSEIIKSSQIRILLQLIVESVEEKKEPIDLIRHYCATLNDDSLMSLAGALMSSEKRISNEIETLDGLVQNVILAKWIEYLKEKRADIEAKIHAIKKDKCPDYSETLQKLEEKKLQISYDIARMKTWEHAVPIIHILQEELKENTNTSG
jgi:DNA primase